MAFRTLEIAEPTETHIKNCQLELSQDEKEPVFIPVEDLAAITVIGPNIRLSTMDLSILSQNHVSITTLDKTIFQLQLFFPSRVTQGNHSLYADRWNSL